MRKFKTIFTVIAFLSLALGASASDQLLNSLKPRYDYAVHDFANVISASDEQRMQSMIAELEQKTGAEVAVVTIQSLDGGQIDDFTTRLFEKWGVGQKGKDNGLMVLAAMSDREMRIEVGYGLEGAIPDSKAGRIRRDVITPYFKQNQPGKGLLAGVAVISQEIAKEYGVALTGEATKYRQSSSRNRSDKKQNPLFTIIFVIIFVIFAIRHPHLAMLLLLSGGRGGGGSSGGGFGGGSGGFGGGMSGGGGSSGGW